MSHVPDSGPLTHTVLVWLEVAQRLHDRGEVALTGVIRAVMDHRRLDALISVDLTDDERVRVQTALDPENDAPGPRH